MGQVAVVSYYISTILDRKSEVGGLELEAEMRICDNSRIMDRYDTCTNKYGGLSHPCMSGVLGGDIQNRKLYPRPSISICVVSKVWQFHQNDPKAGPISARARARRL